MTDTPAITVALVKKLIETQFPKWSNLPVSKVEPGGHDNRAFHLGEKLVVKLPSHPRYESQVYKEHLWLPKIAPQLPLPVPEPVAMGAPDDTFPWSWTINQWIPGETVGPNNITNLESFARDLANFIKALHNIDTTDGPRTLAENFYRSKLYKYDEDMRTKIAGMSDPEHARRSTVLWKRALASEWRRPLVWVHGDLAIGNLLVRGGELAAVIDFGGLGIADPAPDLAVAWTILDQNSRNVFKSCFDFDDDVWHRARAWAYWKTLCHAIKGTDCHAIFTQIFSDFDD